MNEYLKETIFQNALLTVASDISIEQGLKVQKTSRQSANLENSATSGKDLNPSFLSQC